MSLLSFAYKLAILGRVSDAPGAYDPARINKILVVRNDNIGDVICTTPALDALRSAFPQAFIAALVCTLTEDVLSGHPALDKVYAYPKAKHGHYGKAESLRRLVSVLAEIRQDKFDLALALRSGFSTSQGWLTFASRARWRSGPRAQGRKARWGFFYNMPLEPPPGDLHEVERCFHLLRQIQVDSSDKRLYLKVPDAAMDAAKDFLSRYGLGDNRRPVIVNATRWAYRPDRLWPPSKYRSLLEELQAGGWPVVLTHAPQDRDWVAAMLKGLKPRPPVFWSASLKEFAALLSLGRAAITAEGGPMHLAAAMGVPLVVLWGDTPLNAWRPWGVPQEIVRTQVAVSDISVAEVRNALQRLLSS